MAIMHDLHFNLDYAFGLVAASLADNTAQTTAIIDMRGYDTAEFLIIAGTLADADATFAVTLTGGDVVDNEGAPTSITDVGAIDPSCILGSPNFTFANDNSVRRVGYTPWRGAGKRFVRLTITPTGNAGAAPLSVVVVRKPQNYPVTVAA